MPRDGTPNTKPLTERQRRFVEHFTATGSAIESARRAGYKSPHPEGSRLLKNPVVARAIEAAAVVATDQTVADRDARIKFLSSVVFNQKAFMIDRLRAVDILNRMDGCYIERREISGELPPCVAVYI